MKYYLVKIPDVPSATDLERTLGLVSTEHDYLHEQRMLLVGELDRFMFHYKTNHYNTPISEQIATLLVIRFGDKIELTEVRTYEN